MSNNEIKKSKTNIKKENTKLKKLKKRLLYLSPTVELGLERECIENDFELIGNKPIGNGAFGKVWKVIHINTKKEYCIKILNKRDIIEQKLIKQLNKELSIMYEINHPHSIKLVNHFEDDKKIYMIMEYANNGNLFSYMKKNKLNNETIIQFLRETISIVKYLHSLNIIHRDIKPENLLLDNNLRIKLCDYGWATHYNNNEQINTFCGTPEYVAPEIIKKEFYDEKIDIWSIGVLLFEMICNYSPFSANNNNDRFKNIIKGKINWPKNINFKAKNLIEKILKINPNERLSLDDILNDDFVKEYKEIKPELKVMEISKKEIILSHMMNNKKIDNFNNEIDNIIDSDDNDSTNEISMERDDYYKNECKNLKLQIMKIDSERLSFKKKYLEIENIKIENDNLKKEFNSLKNENMILEKKLNERKELINENEKLKKENLDLKLKISNFESNQILFDKLLNENKILKDMLEKKINNKNDNSNQEDNEDLNTKCKNLINDFQSLINELNINLINKKLELSSEKSLKEILDNYLNSYKKELEMILDNSSSKNLKTYETIDLLYEKLDKLQFDNHEFELTKNSLKSAKLDIELLIEECESFKNENLAKEKLINLQKEKIKNLETSFNNLKFQIEDIKIFIKDNCSEKLYEQFYQIISN